MGLLLLAVCSGFATSLRCFVPMFCALEKTLSSHACVCLQFKTDNDRETFKRFFNEVQQAVDSKQLRPMIRTQYNRTAFQVPFDATVRISLDTNLAMIKENTDGQPVGLLHRSACPSMPASSLSLTLVHSPLTHTSLTHLLTQLSTLPFIAMHSCIHPVIQHTRPRIRPQLVCIHAVSCLKASLPGAIFFSADF